MGFKLVLTNDMAISLGRALAGTVAVAGLSAAILAPTWSQAQEQAQLEANQLRDMIKAMGYETKDLVTTPGKEKFEFKITKSDLDIPIAAELSSSKRYIWLTVYLGDTTKISDYASRADKILRANADVQPCQFYVTKSDKLMMGLALENRDLDAPFLRRNVEKVGDDVGRTKDIWSTTD
jgi:hypothetical protein